MPVRLMLFFTLLTPLLGIVQVERGAYAPSSGEWGEPNGATFAFLAYGVFALAGAWMATAGGLFRRPAPARMPGVPADAAQPHHFNIFAIIVSVALCAATLLLFGGLSVLLGEVGKGEFRTSLGGLGALAYLTLKWLAPSIFAFACVLYVFAGRPRAAKTSLVILGLVTFVTGLSWGFKGSGLLIVIPGFVILLWFARLRSFFVFGCVALGSILLGFTVFDTLEGTIYESVLQLLLARLTVFQGDVSWYIWGLWSDGEVMPNYWITPFVAIGDRLFSLITGITRADAEQWILAHYGSLLTYTVGYPIEGIEEGHSVTGTPFSEGIIALGGLGIPVFGLGAGLMTGFVYKKISSALASGRPFSAALWSNYSVWCLFAWLNGGEIVQLFHVSVIVGAIASRVLLASMIATLGVSPARYRYGVSLLSMR